MNGTQQLREKLATACRLLYMEGLMDHAGLAGARIPETGNLLLNPREMRGTQGRHPGIMAAEDLVVVDPEGKKVEGENNPPSETPIFTGVFRARPDVMAIFHLHLPTATLFSMVGKPIRPVFVMGAPFGESVPVCLDSTLIQRPEQGDEVARALGKNLAVLLQGHGAVIVGASVEEAFVASIFLEENAVRQHRASMIGTPRSLEGAELIEAQRQIWHPKVISKVWNYYILKAQSTGILS
ncbi:MAG TPA: class II aldolase/adducin family protein [bacterium]|nr:class II aldolase/adducin family protein [bacterium]